MLEATSPFRDITRASIAAALASLSVAMGTRAGPPVIYVDDSAPAGGDGTSWDHAFRDLQDAIRLWRLHQSNVEIHVGPGTYLPDRGTLDRSASFDLSRGAVVSSFTISLVGGYAGFGAADPNLYSPAAFVTVLSGDLRNNDGANFDNRGDNTRRIVRAEIGANDSINLKGLVISGAHGGVGESDCGAVVTQGGDAYFYKGLIIRDCTVIDNDAAIARGAIVHSGFVCTLTDVVIANNRCLAFSASSGVVVGRRCRILNNQAGGIDFSAGGTGSIYLYQSVIAGNGVESVESATPALRAESVKLTSCSVLGNRSSNTAVITGDYEFSIQGCTIAGNSSHGAIVAGNANRDVSLRASVVWANSALNNFTFLVSAGSFYPFSAEYSDVEFGSAAVRVQDGAAFTWGPGMIAVDPQFSDSIGADGDAATWQDNDYSLLAASPCIDAGGGRLDWRERDVRGAHRSVDGNGDGFVSIDMGSYEFQRINCAADFNGDGVVDDFDLHDFMYHFQLGYLDWADMNGDGFVTGEDFDLFVAAFQVGC